MSSNDASSVAGSACASLADSGAPGAEASPLTALTNENWVPTLPGYSVASGTRVLESNDTSVFRSTSGSVTLMSSPFLVQPLGSSIFSSGSVYKNSSSNTFGTNTGVSIS